MSKHEEELKQNLVKKNLDIIILSMLQNKPTHGYKIIADLHTRFGVLLSPGTLYPLLYRLESQKLITAKEQKRRKSYTLTKKGEQKTRQSIQTYKKHLGQMLEFIDTNLS